MIDNEQTIHNPAPNQGAQGHFHGDVHTGPSYDQQNQAVEGDQYNAGRDIINISVLWQDLGTDMVDKLLDKNVQERWDRVDWTTAAARYNDRMRRRYAEIKMFGSPRPTNLDDIFTDVYILDEPSAYRRFAIHQLKTDPDLLDAERLNGLDVVQHPGHDRLFLLGKPGAGKTTFLKHLALQALQGRIDAIPIFITLKEWADSGLDLMAFIVRQFEICAFPNAQVFIEQTLSAGKALVLFDGLDEVPQERNQHAQSIQALKNVSDQYLDSQMIISCRIAANDYSFTHFTSMELADFDDAQVRTFVTKWFGANERTRDMFFQEYDKNKHQGLRDLARIPLLLSLLCLGFEQTLQFPQRRVDIYKDAIDALLHKWDAWNRTRRDEIYRTLSPDRKQLVLSQVAVATFSNGDYFIPQDTLARMLADVVGTLPAVDRDTIQEVDGEGILKAIAAQHGILIERAHQIYSFAHLSFQEYFTARFIANNADEQRLRRLFQYHLTDSRWREVFLLTASLLNNADTFIHTFRQALDGPIAGDDGIATLLRWAARKAAQTAAGHDQVAARSLYLSLSLARVCDIACDLDLTCDFDLARALVRVIGLARVIYLNQDFDLGCTVSFDIARDLAHDLARDLDIARTIILAIANARTINIDIVIPRNIDIDTRCVIDLDHVLYSAYTINQTGGCEFVRASDFMFDPMPFLARTVSQATDQAERPTALAALHRYITGVCALIDAHDSTSAFAHAIAKLPVPAVDAPPAAWRSYADVLQAILIEHRDIGHAWTLTFDQMERIETYLKTTHLLAECLTLAAVSDRQAIEATLLLPPGEWHLPQPGSEQPPGPENWWQVG